MPVAFRPARSRQKLERLAAIECLQEALIPGCLHMKNDDDDHEIRLEIIEVGSEESQVIATRMANDPSGLAATGNEIPRDRGSLRSLIEKALNDGRRLWRVPLGDDYFAAIVGDDPFHQGKERGLFVWLDPRHRGDDLGIQVVAEAVRRLELEGRDRLVARPPRSNYAALRILNALEFTYVGESDEEMDTKLKIERVVFEHRTSGGAKNPARPSSRLWR